MTAAEGVEEAVTCHLCAVQAGCCLWTAKWNPPMGLLSSGLLVVGRRSMFDTDWPKDDVAG